MRPPSRPPLEAPRGSQGTLRPIGQPGCPYGHATRSCAEPAGHTDCLKTSTPLDRDKHRRLTRRLVPPVPCPQCGQKQTILARNTHQLVIPCHRHPDKPVFRCSKTRNASRRPCCPEAAQSGGLCSLPEGAGAVALASASKALDTPNPGKGHGLNH